MRNYGYLSFFVRFTSVAQSLPTTKARAPTTTTKTMTTGATSNLLTVKHKRKKNAFRLIKTNTFTTLIYCLTKEKWMESIGLPLRVV